MIKRENMIGRPDVMILNGLVHERHLTQWLVGVIQTLNSRDCCSLAENEVIFMELALHVNANLQHEADLVSFHSSVLGCLNTSR